MAPKEDSTRLQFLGNNSLEEEERHKSKDDKKGWKRRLVVALRQWFDGQEENYSARRRYRRTATALLALAAVSAYTLRGIARRRRSFWPVLLAAVQRPAYQKAIEVSLSMLRTAATKGLVHKALVGSGEIVFQDSIGQWKRSKIPPNSPSIKSDLLDVLSRGGCSEVSALPESLFSRLSGPFLAALPFIYLGLMYKIIKNLHGGDVGSKLLQNPRERTRFTDVAGLDPIMGEVEEIVSFLRNPSRYFAVGAQPPRGILLHGAPGSGKTLLARAVAGEANCDTFIACCGSDFVETYVGRGASRVRSLFEKARSDALRKQRLGGWWPWKHSFQQQQQQPPATAIIFIDELDALARSRSYGEITSNDERDQTLNQLLTEMDGFPSEDSGVTIIIIAATNRADVLDPAILRRFDRQLYVPYPDQEGRRDILKIHAQRTHCLLDRIDWDSLASEDLTGNFSGSDLRNLVNDAALLAVRDRSTAVTQRHFELAIKRARAMKVGSTFGDANHGCLWHSK